MLENEIAEEVLRKSGERTVTEGAGTLSGGQGAQRASIVALGRHESQFIPLPAHYFNETTYLCP